jgi:gamma-glutamylcyclotransferase (GGCT)/AIG2-like uncharacterized protein YtfP
VTPNWYFAYGSNMNPQRMRDRGMEFERVIGGRVVGLGLRFNKQSRDHYGCGHANLIYAPAETVEGVLYEFAAAQTIELLDPFENTPVNYSREPLRVCSSMGPITAWAYYANPAVIFSNLRPTQAYLDHLLTGAPFLSNAYLQALYSQQTIELS